MGNCEGFNRRAFLGSVAVGVGSSAILTSNAQGQENKGQENASAKPEQTQQFVASYPILQNVTETSASIAWALNTPSTGWVEWGTTPALGKIARNSEFGLNPFEEDFLSARISGLAPNTKYYYRTATAAFSYRTAYDKSATEPQYSDVYSFTTCGPNAKSGSFFVMNDTHNTIPTIREHVKLADELKPDFILWNGDLCSFYMDAQHIKENIANPTNSPYAAERPIIFVPGNHDRRGSWARNLKKCLTTWEQDDPKFYSLGYNYAFRQGPIAAILLDTGEDKPDWHPAWSEMANYEPYRELQTAWLMKALERPEIKSAPYIVAFCHIPLYDKNPKANPGNILDRWASFQWPCCQMWSPLFEKYGVQLAVAAHQHRFSYAEPTKDRSWAQIVGGGPEMANACSIYCYADENEMKLTCTKLDDKSELGSWTYKPRV